LLKPEAGGWFFKADATKADGFAVVKGLINPLKL
jgi:hypothetical protein